MKFLSITFTYLFISCQAWSQNLQIVTSGNGVSLRGLSTFKNHTWVSGSKGSVGHSADNGKTWNWQKIPGFEKNEFRDIEILNDSTILLMSIASPAYILRSTNYGNSWDTVFYDADSSMFLDAMDFSDEQNGIVIGDPVNGKFFIATSRDGGITWQPSPLLNHIQPQQQEAFFAASGSNIKYVSGKFYLVSGGSISRLIMKANVQKLPLQQGQPTTGANGLAMFKNTIMVAGGNFNLPQYKDSVLVFSHDNGNTFQLPSISPNGYRSSVCAVDQNTWVTCGINGVDISKDGGDTWSSLSTHGFNVCVYNPSSKAVWLAGNNGIIGKIQF